jgi:hypothetical protein
MRSKASSARELRHPHVDGRLVRQRPELGAELRHDPLAELVTRVPPGVNRLAHPDVSLDGGVRERASVAPRESVVVIVRIHRTGRGAAPTVREEGALVESERRELSGSLHHESSDPRQSCGESVGGRRLAGSLCEHDDDLRGRGGVLRRKERRVNLELIPLARQVRHLDANPRIAGQANDRRGDALVRPLAKRRMLGASGQKLHFLLEERLDDTSRRLTVERRAEPLVVVDMDGSALVCPLVADELVRARPPEAERLDRRRGGVPGLLRVDVRRLGLQVQASSPQASPDDERGDTQEDQPDEDADGRAGTSGRGVRRSARLVSPPRGDSEHIGIPHSHRASHRPLLPSERAEARAPTMLNVK